MVRKTIRTAEVPAATILPYPATPLLSDDWGSGAPGLLSPEGHNLDSSSSPDDPADASDTTKAWAAVSRQDRANFIPATRGIAGADPTLKVDTTSRDDSLPPSLRAGLADFTPRSSFESQRSANSAGRLEPAVELSHSTNEPPYTQIVHSNNPFLRTKAEDNSTVRDQTIDGDNSTNIWAATTDQRVQTSQPPPSTYGSLPFAEPWFDFASSPLEQGSPQPKQAFDLPKQNFTSILNPYEELSGNPFDRLDAFEDNHPGKEEPENGNEKPSINTQNIDLQELEGPPRIIDDFAPQYSAEAERHAQQLPLEPRNASPELPERPSLEENNEPRSPKHSPTEPTYLANRGESTNKDQNFYNTLEQKEEQRNETYQIRLVNWYDSVAPNHLRSSPIMVQNANGPCPLLALVNALTLSTPGNIETPLVETLKTREQISLGLLLDAVFDELMSGRRGDAAQSLPDVSDLYSFLITLHTGMNVNPSFVSSETNESSLLDAPILESPNEFSIPRQPGGFEDTREMRLYSTFAVPLIHGWIPPRDHAALGALKRSARTYEEAQTLLFREEEIEDKLQHQGISTEEQIMLEDVATVKYFLATSATQLTTFGLRCISDSLQPGSIAILFRNDHFSTLYKHPQSGQLFTLVTDMGYAGHDEVVWESLVDISGEDCEYFAGDFRPVGNLTGNTRPPSNHVNSENDAGWSTVSRLNGNDGARRLSTTDNHNNLEPGVPSTGFSLLSLDEPVSSSLLTKAEQEDHDLALAMQLQEEEEDRERRASTTRRRQDQLSQAYFDSQSPSERRASARGTSRDLGQNLSPSTGRGQTIRPMVPPRVDSQPKRKTDNNGGDAPPPTYEQAAKGPAYHPPADHPAHTYPLSPTGAEAERPQHTSGYSQTHARVPGAFPTPRGRNFNLPTLVTSPVTGRGGGSRRSRHDGRGRGDSSGFGDGAGGGQRRGEGAGRGNPGEEDDRNCTLM